jgi:hypothetical protein
MFRYLNKLPTFSLLDAGRRRRRRRRRSRGNSSSGGAIEGAIDEEKDDEFHYNYVLGKENNNDDDEDYECQEVGEGGMWRTYKLQCEEMTCLIHEEFHRDAWDLL